LFVHSLRDLEIHADYARHQAEAFASHRSRCAQIARFATPHPPLVQLRRGLGRRLIAAGERLAGPTAPQPTSPCPA